MLKASLAGGCRPEWQSKSRVGSVRQPRLDKGNSARMQRTWPHVRSSIINGGTQPQCGKTKPSRTGLGFSSLQVTGVGELSWSRRSQGNHHSLCPRVEHRPPELKTNIKRNKDNNKQRKTSLFTCQAREALRVKTFNWVVLQAGERTSGIFKCLGGGSLWWLC